MATKKTTTKAKTKTTPKKTTRAATAKAAKKTTTKKITKATSKVAAAKVTPTKQVANSLAKLKQLHLLSALVFAVLAVVTGLFMASTSYELTASLMTNDVVRASAGQTVFAPAIKHMYDIELRWILVSLLVLSAVGSLLLATRLRGRYETKLAHKVVDYRWIDLMVTGALAVMALGLLSGTTDLIALKLLGLTTALAAVFGWLAERENRAGGPVVWGSFVLSKVAKVVVVLMLGMNLLMTTLSGRVRLSWFVYVLFTGLILAFAGYCLNHYKQLKGWNYLIAERNYVLLNLLSKAAFAIILVVGLPG